MTHARGDRGSASLETAVGVPAFVLFVGLIVFGGRTATAHQALEAAAADAARAASLERSPGDAVEAATTAARTSLANQDLACHAVQVEVDTAGFRSPLGHDSAVEVEVSCRLDLSDLSVPGVPGSRTISASMSSPLDSWRERS